MDTISETQILNSDKQCLYTSFIIIYREDNTKKGVKMMISQDAIWDVYHDIDNKMSIKCYIPHIYNGFFDIIHEFEKKFQTSNDEVLDMMVLSQKEKDSIESWYALEQLLIGGYTKTLGVKDISPSFLLEIIRNCYQKPMFYFQKEHKYDGEKIKEICKKHEIIFIEDMILETL